MGALIKAPEPCIQVPCYEDALNMILDFDDQDVLGPGSVVWGFRALGLRIFRILRILALNMKEMC